MSGHDDGGPAFPRTGDAVANEFRDFDLNGMSLRDYFAAKAMAGLLSDGEQVERMAEYLCETGVTLGDEVDANDALIFAHVAKLAYVASDAMLEARKKGTE